MKQVWMANDGSVFDTEAECSEYERAACGVFYFTGMGKDTEKLEEATIVFVRDKDGYWVNEYEFDKEKSIDGPGWYVWSASEHKYWHWDEIEELYQVYKEFINAKINEGLIVKWD